MIAILGSGPSGLMAAWACLISGKDFVIYSKTSDKPTVSGFSYLHESCNLPLQKYKLNQIFFGSDSVCVHDLSVAYNKKVYNKEEISSSFIKQFSYGEFVDIYNLNEAIDIIWDLVCSKIKIRDISTKPELLNVSSCFDTCVSTIPFNIFCKECSFVTSSYILSHADNSDLNYCMYNPFNTSKWYRKGKLFNTYFEEYANTAGNIKKVLTVNSEVFKDFPKNILFCGRYGSWDKSVLTHDVYNTILGKIIGNEI